MSIHTLGDRPATETATTSLGFAVERPILSGGKGGLWWWRCEECDKHLAAEEIHMLDRRAASHMRAHREGTDTAIADSKSWHGGAR